jgi:hypothetical protein
LPWLTIAENLGFAANRAADAEWVAQLPQDVGLAGMQTNCPSRSPAA